VKPTGEHRMYLGGQPFTASYAAIRRNKDSSIHCRFSRNSNWACVRDWNYQSLEEALDDLEKGYAGANTNVRKPI
jgi:hypothetical protein